MGWWTDGSMRSMGLVGISGVLGALANVSVIFFCLYDTYCFFL